MLAGPTCINAKVQSGKVHLSGVKTESTLVKFAVPPSSSVELDVTINSYGMYIDEKDLRIRIYVDDEWPSVRHETMCTKKITYSLRSVPVIMEYVGTVHDDRRVKTNGNLVEMYASRVIVELDNPPPRLPSDHVHAAGKTRHQLARSDRSRYYYFVIDDCSLEERYNDNKIPDMTYTASVKVARWGYHHDHEGMIYSEHLPADEDGIRPLLYVTILFSSALLLLLLRSMVQTTSTGEVHVAILIVMAACITNGLSAVCELLHMNIFSINGIGNYSLDALSSHFEALSDSMVSLILLSIGGGWTLPSDVGGSGLGGGLNSSSTTNNKLIINPAGSLLNLVTSGGAGGDGAGGISDRSGGIVAILIIAIHAILAQWGRTFDDDFDTYHALEHPPGKALMILRFVLGLIFITGVGAVRSGSHGRCPPSLLSFLTKFALVGLSYFASLPGVSMFVGSALPYHRRHQALHYGAALVQSCSLASLTWLFVGGDDASAYHRLSKVGKKRDGVVGADMADATTTTTNGGTKARPKMWKFGKTKIRLD